MEVKEWTYEEMPSFDKDVEGAMWLESTGDEMEIQYHHDIEYLEIDGTKLHLQILTPFVRNEPDKTYPCVMWVQGSAWFEQYVYMKVAMAADLVKRGYVVAIIEYRHSGIAPFPAQIMDAKNAIRYMRVHAAEYHVDPENIILGGDSSGGHTAAYAGILHNDEDPKTNLFLEVSGEPICIINHYGSTSVMAEDSNPSQLYHCLPDSPEGMVMGHVNLLEHPELQRKLSLECNITAETEIAPMIIFHGTKDRVVNVEGSVALYRVMKKYGKDVSLYLIKGADHGGAEFWTKEVLDLTDAFIRRCMK